MSGSEGSSTKQSTSVCCKGARMELWKKVTHGAMRQQRAHGFLENTALRNNILRGLVQGKTLPLGGLREKNRKWRRGKRCCLRISGFSLGQSPVGQGLFYVEWEVGAWHIRHYIENSVRRDLRM